MKQWLWLSQGFTVFMVAILVGAASAISAFVAASQVETHIDSTIAQTINDQLAKSRNTSEQTQKLFAEVDSICQTLKQANADIHC